MDKGLRHMAKEGDFRKILAAAAGEMGIDMPEDRIALFETYREILLLWNSKMNLVSLQSELDLPVRHFMDSLSLLPFLPAGPCRLIDIGSGAGFPAIPVKIVRTDLHVTLLEASRKKCSFLKELIRTLGLRDIAVVNSRIESLLAAAPPPQFDAVVSRATFKMIDLVKNAFPLLKSGGILLAMKGPGIEEETAALDSLRSVPYRIVKDHSFTLPLTGDRRRIVLVDKPA
jgi:16S rRNA (guanine527-N7)-methyltransferase